MEDSGLAVANVAIREDLRPWYQAGVQHLFMDDAVTAWIEQGRREQQTAAPQASARAQAPAAGRPVHSSGLSAAEETTPETPARSIRRQAPRAEKTPVQASSGNHSAFGQSGRASAPVRPVTHEAPAACTMQEDTPPPPQASSMPPEQWPPQWQAAWSKIPGPAPVVWTYWSLGDDLCGNANAERGALLRKIIGSLRLPRGTSAFWPVALPAAPAPDEHAAPLQANPEIFLAGINRIRPRRVFAFGSRALRSFAPHCGLRPYQFVHYNGFRLYAMPDIDYLLESPAPVEAVISCLKVALQKVSR
jgi:hypothetical protein